MQKASRRFVLTRHQTTKAPLICINASTPRPALAVGEDDPHVWGRLDARGSFLYDFEFGPRYRRTGKVQVVEKSNRAAADDLRRVEHDTCHFDDAPRPPRGSGYIYPDHGGPCPRLEELLGPRGVATGIGSGTSRPVSERRKFVGSVSNSAKNAVVASELCLARRRRIEALEQGMEAHEQEKLGVLALGTAPLLGARGQPVLAVPPSEPPKASRLDRSAFTAIRIVNESAEAGLRRRLKAEQILGLDPKDRDEFELPPSRGINRPRSALRFAAHQTAQEPDVELRRCSVGELLRAAQRYAEDGAADDQWARLVSQFCAKAYNAESFEVLWMVKALGTAARTPFGQGDGAGRKHLMQAAEQLLQSMIGHLLNADIEHLVEVVETMSDAGVGSQAYLDMIMALSLERHHHDDRHPSASVALRLASALGRISSSLQLNPNGIDGALSTNSRVMKALDRRIVEQLDDCAASELAELNDHYLAQLCGDRERRAIVERMADLDIGFLDGTGQWLPTMARMRQSIRRELGDGFVWSMPQRVQDYFDKLR